MRTVGFADFDGELWPVQIEPFRAFGGICPVAVEYDAYPVEVTLYAAPAPGAAMEFREPSYVAEWMVEDWPVYTEGYPEWLLVGVIADGDLGCAWGKRAGT